MEKCHETCQIGRVEDDDNMFYIRAVCLKVLSELLGDFAVPLEEVFAGHALLARGAA